MDCLSNALLALKLLGLSLTAIPAIGVQADLPWRGYYTRLAEQPVVVIRDAGDCYALTHELLHHWIAEREGWDITQTPSEQRAEEWRVARMTHDAAQAFYGETRRSIYE